MLVTFQLARGKENIVKYASQDNFKLTAAKFVGRRLIEFVSIKTTHLLSTVSHESAASVECIDSHIYSSLAKAPMPVLHAKFYDLIRNEIWREPAIQLYARKFTRLVFDIAEHDPSPYQLQTVKVTIGTQNDGRLTYRSELERSKYLFLKKTMNGPTRNSDHSGLFIGLGSNVGDRIKMIENACREMDNEGIKVIRTSPLYETKAMYFEDQNLFLNGVCEVSDLLPQLKCL